MAVESNLIIRSSVPKPDRLTGFLEIKKNLTDIQDKLKVITDKPWTIKVGLDVTGIPDLDKLLNAARNARGGGGTNRVTGFGGGSGGGGGGVGSGNPAPSGRGGRELQTKTIEQRDRETGDIIPVARIVRRRRIVNGREVTTDETTGLTGDDAGLRTRVITDRNLDQPGLRSARSRFIDEQIGSRRKVFAEIQEQGSRGGIPFTVERLEAVTKTAKDAKGNVIALEKEILELNSKTGEASRYPERQLANERLLAKEAKARTTEEDKRLSHQRRTMEFYAEVNRLLSQGAILTEKINATGEKGNRILSAKLALPSTNGISEIASLSNTGTPTSIKSKLLKEKSSGSSSIASLDAEVRRNKDSFQQHASNAISEGFVASAPKITQSFDKFGRAISNVTQEFAKTTQVGLGKYVVTLRQVDDATGKMTETTKTGGAAIRYMGDTFLTAIGKVKLWVAATSAVFIAVSAIKAAATASRQLEENTIFLARVGTRLVAAENGAATAFTTRRKAAQQLTEELLTLATATGADAIASQKAAAVFLRAGQNREETVLSVKAALLAAKIAELEVVDAANLLSAAMLQFNLKARDLLPTLDTLNELSNHYRVTTDDLLQSISRTGSVVEAQGGRLSELGSITAIVSQRTARSGAEIGNAIKTISSRLVSPDVAKSIEEVGVSLRNADGTSRSLSEVLLELRNSFRSLTKAEQDQLTVGIAGVRQRNILISAIEGSIDSVLAEIKILQNAGSAEEEFAESSTTLTSSIQRLSNTLIKFISVTGGPVTTTIKAALDLFQFFISILTSSGGQLVSQVLLFSVAFAGVSRTIKAVHPAVFSLAGNMKALSQSIFVSAASGNATTSVFSRLAVSTRNVASATITGTLAFIKANALTAGATAVLYVLTKQLGAAAAAHATRKAAIETDTQFAEKNVIAVQKQSQATTVAIGAILQQITAIQKLNRVGSTGAKEQIADIEKDVARIAAAADIKIPIGLEFTDKDAVQKFIAAANKKLANNALVESGTLEEANSRRFDSIQNKNQELEDIRSKKRIREQASKSSRGLFFSAVDSGGVIGLAETNLENEAEIRNLASDEKRLLSEIRNVNDEIAETRKKIKELDTARGAFKNVSNDAIQLQTNLVNVIDASVKLDEALKLQSDIGKAFGIGDAKLVTDALRQQNKALSETDAAIVAIEKINNRIPGSLESAHKQYEKQKETVRELLTEVAKLNAESARASLRQNITSIDSLRTNANILKSRAGRGEGLEGVRGLLDLQAERNSLLAQVRARAIAVANGNGLEGGPQAAAQRDAAQENLNSLREKELALAKEVQDTEARIAEQRKKSADEIHRALGDLSTEDKIRFETALNFFEQNPKERITTTDLFNNSAETNNIITKFFANRIDNNPNDPFNQRVASVVRSPEQVALEKEQAALDQVRGGQNTDEFVAARVEGAQAATNKLRELGGELAVQFTEGFISSLSNTDINVDLNKTAASLGNVFDHMITKIDETMAGSINALQKDIDVRFAELKAKPLARQVDKQE